MQISDILPKIVCTYCQEDVSGVRVQCCDCPEFDICLQCFAAGAEIGPHKNDHSYRFVDHGSVSIFGGRGAWTGREHLSLLEAAELYSYGNWELVAKHVESRTAEECKEEYTARYLDGNIGKATWGNVLKPNLIIDLIEDDGPLSSLALSKLAPLDATLEEAKILGYKPHRDDFEGEYDPEAEHLIADLHSGDQEECTDVEAALKLAVVDMYIRRLRERQRHKRIVRDYQLVAKYFDNLRRDPSRPLYPKEQKELRDHMRPFAQFLNSGEHERLIASIEREQELRQRLSELKRYRSVGLTTQNEIIHYEQHMAYQRQQIRQGKVGSSGSMAQTVLENPCLTSAIGGEETASNSTGARTTWPSGNDSGYDSGAAPTIETTPTTTPSLTATSSMWTPQPQLAAATKSDVGLESGRTLALRRGQGQLCTNYALSRSLASQ
ncbi:transcriptional adapter 2B isoform X1 [Euwallacea similis]|uniref:transcriptional adapter 2B isoform X1 n=1 Tax=Euwallacea similis TaxID=1736056 RepID=UPI00344E4C60